MITRTQIRQFLAVVDSGSFTRAAQQINVTQPTLSTGIAELEKSLDTKLFIREKRRIQLTEAGTQFLSHARKIQSEFRAAESNIAQIKPPIEPIKLGLLNTIATHVISPIILSHQADETTSPLHILEGREAEIANYFARGEVDVIISTFTVLDQNVEFKLLLEEPYRLMVSDRHKIANRKSVSPAEIGNETMIARRSCEILKDTSNFFTSHGVRPPFSLRSANDDRAMAMVAANLGVTVAPASHLRKGLSSIELSGFSLTRKVVIAWNARDEFQKQQILQFVKVASKLL